MPARHILHVDLDAFFASVEALVNPALQGRPVIVGARPGQRGVVAAASYEARRFGVHSAMPINQAAHLCPYAVFLPPRHGLYQQYSRRVMALLGEYTPLVEQASVDEAYLDVTGTELLHGDAEALAHAIQRRVRHEIGLPCSLGIASTKLVAKIASSQAKPNGVVVVPAGQEAAFLAPLPIDALRGIGPRTAAQLRAHGITRVGQLAEAPAAVLRQLLGQHAENFRLLALGGPPTPVLPGRAAKQVSHEQTFDQDVTDPLALRRHLLDLADRVAERLRRHGLLARRVTLKLRYGDFTTLTRSTMLARPTDLAEPLFRAAEALWARTWRGRPVRLLGVAAGALQSARAYQPDLFDAREPRLEHLAHALDAIRARYGRQAIMRAAIMPAATASRPRLPRPSAATRPDGPGQTEATQDRARGRRP